MKFFYKKGLTEILKNAIISFVKEISEHLILNAVIISILFLFLALAVCLIRRENRKRHIASTTSDIKNLLLDINRLDGNIEEALRHIAVFAKSRSAFYVDTAETKFNFVFSFDDENIITGNSRKYFMSQILACTAKAKVTRHKAIDVIILKVNSLLKMQNREFYDFLAEHKISNIVFAFVIDKRNRISLLGVINPKKIASVKTMLSDISVCFSIAIYNKKQLNKTERAATTDSLTGLSNRVAYNRELKRLDKENRKNLACIYIDVDELHLCNNKYGHAFGNDMLIYIANTLKEVFYGFPVYRMGGDEFLIFVEHYDERTVRRLIDIILERLEPMHYHISVGMSYREQGANAHTEEIVLEAEKKMYDTKAKYYQSKSEIAPELRFQEYETAETGNAEIDTILTSIKNRYVGIYNVSLDNDTVHCVLYPKNLHRNENENSFKSIFKNYIAENANHDFHRSLTGFINYDALKEQLHEGGIPKIVFKNAGNENICLSVYPIGEEKEINNTLWVFEKM